MMNRVKKPAPVTGGARVSWPRREARTISTGAAAVAALMLALAGCAGSPPVRYYTLVAPLSAADRTLSPVVADYAIELMPISVPAQVDQPQLMLRSGAGQLTAQYSDRWSAPLPDELHNALSDAMTRQLGVPDISQLASAPDMPVWRVQVDIQRFDASTLGPAVIDATWRVRPATGAGAGLLCRNRVETPVAPSASGEGLDAVVMAEQRAVALLGQTIASAVQSQGRQAVAASPLVQTPRCTP